MKNICWFHSHRHFHATNIFYVFCLFVCLTFFIYMYIFFLFLCIRHFGYLCHCVRARASVSVCMWFWMYLFFLCVGIAKRPNENIHFYIKTEMGIYKIYVCVCVCVKKSLKPFIISWFCHPTKTNRRMRCTENNNGPKWTRISSSASSQFS